ncbi:MAG: DNA mismatch repair protein MutS, partial [Leptospiraceae bacterium]|nr:DNA mismatch repair protein MutS [Leptospiraceae bacterium]
NHCVTSPGKRLLRKKILFPLLSKEDIESVWNSIDNLSANRIKRTEIIEKLSDTSDLNRILSRFVANKAYPRDFKTIQKNIEVTLELSKELELLGYKLDPPGEKILSINEEIIKRVSEGELPAVLGGDGRFLKAGYSEELDKARESKSEGKNWILKLEETEKKKTGIGTLKIKYNKVVGYFVELSRKDSKNVPPNYLKKQTLVTSERFTLPELEDIERTILSADDIITRIEQEEFQNLIHIVLQGKEDLQKISSDLSELDYLLSLSICKDKYNWIKPEINSNGDLELEDATR